jgi:hypothetical protein
MSTKGVSGRSSGFQAPRAKEADADGDGAPGVSTPKQKTPVKKTKSSGKAEKAKAPKQQQRSRGAGGAHAPSGAHGAEEEEGGGAGGALGAVSEVGEVDEMHRRRGGEVEHVDDVEEEHEIEEGHETAATGTDSVKRSKGGDSGSSDGFDQSQKQREAYERMLKGNVKTDQERLAALRAKGLTDAFNPGATPADVEKQGMPRLAAHVVRLFDAWTLSGVTHAEAVEKMAGWMAELSTPQTIKKLLIELESKPIRDVYPLELLMHMLEHRPELLPHVKKGAVLGNAADLADGKKVFAGHPTSVQVPPDTRIKSLALLGGGRPGYEFHPTLGNDNTYTLLIDTPGRWKFSLLAVPMVSLGRIQKEGPEAILEIFEVTVHAMGKKGEPMSPEAWWAEQRAAAGDDDDADDDADLDDVDIRGPAEVAPLMILQIRKALEAIHKDPPKPGQAQTYSWDVRFYAPGAPVDGEGVLHLVVDAAGPFDPVWARAREGIMQKQKEYEPGRALITQEDVASALRRARVRD